MTDSIKNAATAKDARETAIEILSNWAGVYVNPNGQRNIDLAIQRTKEIIERDAPSRLSGVAMRAAEKINSEMYNGEFPEESVKEWAAIIQQEASK